MFYLIKFNFNNLIKRYKRYIKNCKITFNLNSWIKFMKDKKSSCFKIYDLFVFLSTKTISNNFYMKFFFFFFVQLSTIPYDIFHRSHYENVIPRGIWTDKFSDNNMLSSCKNCSWKMEQDSSESVTVSLPREKTERLYVKFRY